MQPCREERQSPWHAAMSTEARQLRGIQSAGADSRELNYADASLCTAAFNRQAISQLMCADAGLANWRHLC
jgi:hypothetical protein